MTTYRYSFELEMENAHRIIDEHARNKKKTFFQKVLNKVFG